MLDSFKESLKSWKNKKSIDLSNLADELILAATNNTVSMAPEDMQKCIFNDILEENRRSEKRSFYLKVAEITRYGNLSLINRGKDKLYEKLYSLLV